MNETPLLEEPDSPEPERLDLKVHARAYWQRIQSRLKSRRRIRIPKPAKTPVSAKVKEERIQWAVYLTFAAGWMLATWGVVLATGWGWLWPVSVGAFMMGAAWLVFWAMVQEKRGTR